MSKTRYIKTDFWSDSFIEWLTPEQKLLYIYLFSNDKVDLCGIYEISYRKISFETWIQQEKVEKYINYFSEKWKAIYIWWYMYMTNFIKNLSINPSVKSWIERSFLSLPQEVIDNFWLEIESNWNVIKRVWINKYQRKRILERDWNKCVDCWSEEKLEIDHILPVCRWWRNVDENLRVLCRDCNTIHKNRQALTGSDRLWQDDALIPIPILEPEPILWLEPKPLVVALQPNEYQESISFLKSIDIDNINIADPPEYARGYKKYWIEFILYWTEKSRNWKLRAEWEKTFEVKRRFYTWLSRAKVQYEKPKQKFNSIW